MWCSILQKKVHSYNMLLFIVGCFLGFFCGLLTTSYSYIVTLINILFFDFDARDSNGFYTRRLTTSFNFDWNCNLHSCNMILFLLFVCKCIGFYYYYFFFFFYSLLVFFYKRYTRSFLHISRFRLLLSLGIFIYIVSLYI